MNAKKQFNNNLNLLIEAGRLQAQIPHFEEMLGYYLERVERMADAFNTVGNPDVEKIRQLRTLLQQMDDDLHTHAAALHAEIMEAKL